MQNDQAPVNLEALSKSAGPVDVTVSPQETTEDAEHRRWKDKIVFLVSVSALVLVFVACLGVLIFGSQTPDEKKIWAGVLVSLITGLLGYKIGKTR